MTFSIGTEEDGTPEEAIEAFEKIVELEEEQGDKGEWFVGVESDWGFLTMMFFLGDLKP